MTGGFCFAVGRDIGNIFIIDEFEHLGKWQFGADESEGD